MTPTTLHHPTPLLVDKFCRVQKRGDIHTYVQYKARRLNDTTLNAKLKLNVCID